MSDFDYSKDIAPLRGNYFNDPRLTDRERTRLRSGYVSDIDPLIKAHQDLDILERNKQRDDLAYQTGLFSLRRQRQDLRAERDEVRALAEARDFLTQQFDDPNKGVVDKAKALAGASAKYAGVMTPNGPLSQVFTSYSERLGLESQVEAQRNQDAILKKTREDAAKFEAARAQIAAGVDPEEVKTSLFGATEEEIDPDERSFLTNDQLIRKALIKREEAAAKAAEAAGISDARQKGQDERRKGFETFVRGIAFDAPEEDPDKPTLKHGARITLKEGLKRIYGLTDDKIPKDDEALLRLANELSFSSE